MDGLSSYFRQIEKPHRLEIGGASLVCRRAQRAQCDTLSANLHAAGCEGVGGIRHADRTRRGGDRLEDVPSLRGAGEHACRAVGGSGVCDVQPGPVRHRVAESDRRARVAGHAGRCGRHPVGADRHGRARDGDERVRGDHDRLRAIHGSARARDDDSATVVDDGGDRHGGGGARVGRHAGVVDTSVVVALAGRVTGVRIEADGAGIGRHRVGVHHPSIGVVLQRRKRVTAGEGHDEREHRNEPLATELSHDALLRATVISYMITVEF